MGDGLKRAFAATARTRADASLTPEMRRFLLALPQDGRLISARQIDLSCTPAQDKARQRCHRFGYAWYRVWPGNRGWQITPLGLKELEPASSPSRAEGA